MQVISAPIVQNLLVNAPKHHSPTENNIIRNSKLLLIRLDALETLHKVFIEFKTICQIDSRRESSASETLKSMRQKYVEWCIECYMYLISTPFEEGFYVVLHNNKPKLMKAAQHIEHQVAKAASTVVKKVSQPIHKLQGKRPSASSSTSSSSSEQQAEIPVMEIQISCDLHPITGNILRCCKELAKYKTSWSILWSLTKELKISLPEDMPCGFIDFLIIVLENLYNGLLETAIAMDTDKALDSHRSIHLNVHNLHEDAEQEKLAEQFILSARKYLFMANNVFAIRSFCIDVKNGYFEESEGEAKMPKEIPVNPSQAPQPLSTVSKASKLNKMPNLSLLLK